MPGPRICASTESDRDPGRGGGAVFIKAGGDKKAGFNSVTITWVTLLSPTFQKFWVPPLSVSIFSQ